MAKKKKTCNCATRLGHSVVKDVRFRWVKTQGMYEKYRRRRCTVCGGFFSTVEIDKRDMYYEEDE